MGITKLLPHPYMDEEGRINNNLVVGHLKNFGDYLFLAQWGEFLAYNGKYWQKVKKSIFANRVRLLTKDNLSTNIMKEIIEQFKLDIEYPLEELSPPNPRYLNLENGILDLETQRLLPHDKLKYFTSIIPVKFAPEANCEKWKGFLTEITKGSVELQIFLQELFGYCLTRDNKHQVFFIFLGKGGNGKSVLLEILRSLLGPTLTASLSIADLSQKFKLINLVNKNANLADETPSSKALDSDMLKKLSAGGSFYVEQKFKPSFEVKNTAKLIFSANSSPNLRDFTNALRRRLKVIPFKYQVPKHKMNKNLIEDLSKELPGILNWAIKGLERLNENGDFTDCDLIEEANNFFLSDTDSVKRFIDDHCTVSSDENVYSHELYRFYKRYCDEVGSKYCSDNEFGKRLLYHFSQIEKHRDTVGDRRYRYTGVSIRDEKEFRLTFNGEDHY